jgi:RHS repeat-associated protein
LIRGIRLTQAVNPLPTVPLESFTYDGLGNRTTSNQNGASSFNQANELLEDANFTYQYDNNGNMTRKTAKAGGAVTTYEYDAENKLVRIVSPSNTVNYRYDGLGRRVEKEVIAGSTTTTRYVYDNEDILLELNGSNAIVARYTHGPGIDEPLIMEKSSQSFYYHADGLGSITELTNQSGTVVQRYTYSSFGKIESQLDPNFVQSYMFTVRELDLETDAYHYRERQYDWNNGRFTTEDPIGYNGGENFYVYVGNNATNFNDPLGLFLLPITLIPPNTPGLNLPVPSPENAAVPLPPITYGNYGGGGWTGGYTGTRKPADSLDECFKDHDECYGRVQQTNPEGRCNAALTIPTCDKSLIDCMRMLPPDPHQWLRPARNPFWANLYRRAADWYFR